MKQGEKEAESVLDKVYDVLSDIKDTVFDTFGLASKTVADKVDQLKKKMPGSSDL